MKALFLGCHCDDIELGCGGTIHKYRDLWDITCVTFSSYGSAHGKDVLEVKEYSKNALSFLGAKDIRHFDFPLNDFWMYRQDIWQTLAELESSVKPDIVFTQGVDQHQDHEVLFKETLRNFKKIDTLSYQYSLRNTLSYNWNWFEILLEEEAVAKAEIFDYYPCYQHHSYFKKENIIAQMRTMAMYTGSDFAEAFCLVKKVNPCIAQLM